MLSASSPLLVLLLTVLQLALSVGAKGGKGSKFGPKAKNVYKENGKCYDEKSHVETECPGQTNVGLVLGITAGVVGVIVILSVVTVVFERHLKKKKKALKVKSKGIDDASSDHESIVPLVRGDTKESDSLYSYEDKSMHA